MGFFDQSIPHPQDIDEWRASARVTETPCACGSVHVLDGYGAVENGMGTYAACLDCSVIREFTPDAEGNVAALPPERAALAARRHADGTVHEPPAWRDAIHKLFVGIIAWSGDEDGCFHEAVQPGIDAALAVLRDGSCSECGGAGWRWVNTPKGDWDMVLRRCAHVPGCHCDDGGQPWHDADCPLSEDNRPTPTPTAPEGEECAPTCRTITQQVNSDWCHRCRQRMRRYAEGINEPFCACGRRISDCDGSRVGCGKRPTPTQKGGGDA